MKAIRLHAKETGKSLNPELRGHNNRRLQSAIENWDTNRIRTKPTEVSIDIVYDND